MKLYKFKKTFAVILCICFVMASFLSMFFIITHENHQCTGKACAVCCQLINAKIRLKQLTIAEAEGRIFLHALTLFLICVVNYLNNRETVSLVTLNIRMDN